MKPFLLSLVVICLSVPVFLAAGSAQGIDPQCTGMRDKVGCTCAVQTAEMLLPIARTDMGNGLGAIQDAAFRRPVHASPWTQVGSHFVKWHD